MSKNNFDVQFGSICFKSKNYLYYELYQVGTTDLIFRAIHFWKVAFPKVPFNCVWIRMRAIIWWKKCPQQN